MPKKGTQKFLYLVWAYYSYTKNSAKYFLKIWEHHLPLPGHVNGCQHGIHSHKGLGGAKYPHLGHKTTQHLAGLDCGNQNNQEQPI